MRRAFVLAACLGLAACGGPNHAPTAGPSPTPTPTVRTLAEAAELDQFDGLHARPSMSTELSGDRSRGVLAMTPDGLLVAVVNEAPPSGPDPGIHQSRLELIDPDGDTTTIPGQDGTQPRQAIYGAADERWVVWVETPSTQVGASDWVLLAYDRQTKQTHVVDRAATGADTSANAPLLAGDRVWWSVVEFSGKEDQSPTTKLYSHGLTDAAPTRLEISGVGDAAIADNRLVYTVKATGPYRQVEIHRRYLSTGADSVLETIGISPEGSVHSLSTSGDDIAWVRYEGDAGTLSKVMLRQADGTTTVIDGGRFSLAIDVLSRDLLAWHDGNEGGGEWILDRHRDRIVHLGDQPGLAAIVGSGNHLAWREGDVWRVADLT